MSKYKLGIIGAGNMSSAITKGILINGVLSPEEIIVSDLSDEKLAAAGVLGVATTKDNLLLARSVEYLLFAVKPQSFPEIGAAIKGAFGAKVISIMAGITISTLKATLGAEKICRVMPNTPCMIGSGMSALTFDGYDDEEKVFPRSVFSSLGEIIELDESKFDAVTSVSGSGPAYAYMFAQGMIKGGINGGLTFDEAKKLTLATLIGGARMIEHSDKPIDELIDAVCSKGGTTIQAVAYYRLSGLVDTIAVGVDRCRARSVEMSHPNGESVITMYTDGACSGNPGPGGYCAILSLAGLEKVISGGEKETTNNRMELMAVIRGLESLKKPHSVVEVHSDSAYVVNAINNDWLKNWQTRRWENVKNVDLWKSLMDLLSVHDVRFIKVKGHSDNEMNNRCDEIAREEVKKQMGE